MKTFDFEWRILDFFDNFKSDILNTINQYFSNIFGSIGLIIIFLVIYWVINKEKGLHIGFSLAFSMVINNFLKGLILRKRPFEIEGKEYLRKLSEAKDHATGTSFPSGHSMNSASLYTGLIVNYRHKRFLILHIISVILLVLVGITRIYLGVHFPTDVIVGINLGVLVAIVTTFLQEALTNKKWILYVIITMIFAPFLFFNMFGKDFIKSYGMILGITVGHLLEVKFVDFNASCSASKKINRLIIGLIVVGGLYLIYNVVPNPIHDNFVFVLVMHFLISFSGIFLVPLIFKKIEGTNKAIRSNIL